METKTRGQTKSCNRLPDKLSELIRVAAQDAKKCEGDPRYVLRMGTWKTFMRGTGKCHVCMAGAVMAQTLNVGIEDDWGDAEVGRDTRAKLEIVNFIRYGNLGNALASLEGEDTAVEFADDLRCISGKILGSYDGEEGRAPWNVYLEVADDLEKLGL